MKVRMVFHVLVAGRPWFGVVVVVIVVAVAILPFAVILQVRMVANMVNVSCLVRQTCSVSFSLLDYQ